MGFIIPPAIVAAVSIPAVGVSGSPVDLALGVFSSPKLIE